VGPVVQALASLTKTHMSGLHFASRVEAFVGDIVIGTVPVNSTPLVNTTLLKSRQTQTRRDLLRAWCPQRSNVREIRP
jgi:hypothetical protein